MPSPVAAGRVGFIGLGKIGYALARNMIRNGAVGSHPPIHFDVDSTAVTRLAGEGSIPASSNEEVASSSDIVFSVLPNDKTLSSVVFGKDGDGNDCGGISACMKPQAIHVSCSTVSPWTSRLIAIEHAKNDVGFVSAPVFSRPDGMAAGQATIPISAAEDYVQRVKPLLQTIATGVYDTFGSDPGAANVVKLAGNFLIGAAIESLAEAYSMAEANGVDRAALHEILTDTIFDCLIYKGYGQRVAMRDHAPYPDAHFALDLGRKDMTLVRETGSRVNVPMPIASLLVDRFATATAKGRSDLDWSAISLASSEDAGVDVSAFEEHCRRHDPKLDWKPPVK